MHSFTSSKITLTLGQQVIEKIYMFHTSGCNFICGVCREGEGKKSYNTLDVITFISSNGSGF